MFETKEPSEPSLENGAATDESSVDTSPPVKDELNFALVGFDGCPIVGLKCRVQIGEKFYNFVTDSDGKSPTLEHKPGDNLIFNVERDNKTYKEIAKVQTSPGSLSYTLISPAFVVETETEEHQGAPGSSTQAIPQPVKSDAPTESQETKASTQESAPSSTTNTPAAAPSAQPPAKVKPTKAKTKAKPSIEPTKKIAPSPKISGALAAKPTPTRGRDDSGNPLAVITEKVSDWWGRWRMPTLNLWSWDDFVNHLSNGNTALNRAIPSATAPAQNKSQLERMNLLIQTATEHTGWVISESTAEAAAQMLKGTFKQHGKGKGSNEAKGWCAKYVKIALTQANVTPNTAKGLLQFASGSEGGAGLVSAGFHDVTAEIPDARWAAPGDVIVYRWSDTTWSKRKASPRWGGTAKKPNPNVPNHGHIDIRSYDNYISDFMPNSKHPRWSDYTNVRIYRSAYFDALPELRMKAFLHCIREFECQAEKDDSKRYGMLNTPLPESKTNRFTDFTTHPWATVDAAHRSKFSAAGAYQITFTTWRQMVEGIDSSGKQQAAAQNFFIENNEPKFNPALQDRIAIALIDGRTGAPLGDIRNGEIEAAVGKLVNEWTSLPGAKENAHRRTADNKPMDMTYFKTLFNKYLDDLLVEKGLK
jgi:muramidase (phage lysozyme)